MPCSPSESPELGLAEVPVALELVDLVATIAFVADEPAAFERIDQLLGLELRALQKQNDRCAKVAFAPDVPRRRYITEVDRQLSSKLFEVEVLGNHAWCIYVLRRDPAKPKAYCACPREALTTGGGSGKGARERKD